MSDQPSAALLDWMRDAACKGQDPDIFFPHPTDHAIAAKAVCAGCGVAEACLAYALAYPSLAGVWGGKTYRERRRIRRRQMLDNQVTYQ